MAVAESSYAQKSPRSGRQENDLVPSDLAYDGDVLLHGDSSRRVTVAMPQSFQELQYHANRNFATDKVNPRMFHHGRNHMHHHHHVKQLQHGDVVIVEKGQRVPSQPPGVTTHMADYVPHPLEERAAPKLAQAGPSAPFHGVSSYANDYVEHPVKPRKPVAPPATNWPRAGRTGDTMYKTQYPRHDIDPRPAVQPQPSMPIRNVPFYGDTSYKNDYVKHPIRPRSSRASKAPRGMPAPFEGTTTYNTDFQKYHTPRAGPTRPYPSTLRPDTGPFEGIPEYKREYIKHPLEEKVLVHLEPELTRFRTSSLGRT